MDDQEIRKVRIEPPPATHPRRSRRRPIPGTLVAVDVPSVADKPWVVAAVDINADGMGLVLPSDIPQASDVFLTFQLEDVEFARVPAVVVHQKGYVGGVIFAEWTPLERLRLLEILVRYYESEAPAPGTGG